ncbi:MAG: hypothetical protein WAW10_03505 [Gallionella sp.]
MNLMFWKKKTGAVGDAETSPDESGSPDSEAPAKPGLITGISSRLAALVGRFKKPPAFSAEGDQAADATQQPESAPEDASPPSPPNLKKRLMMGGAIGLTVLLLAGIGFAVWKIFLSAPAGEADASAAAGVPRTARPASPGGESRAEIEALRKKNEELKAQIDALKKEQPRQQPVEPAAQPSGDNLQSSDSGDIMVDNKDPKATAMSLKEAIDAMNESSGDYGKKNAK